MAASRLRALLAQPNTLHLMPCCGDALGARLIEAAGFPLTFVSGFAASAHRGVPDTGLLSYGEMLDTMRQVGSTLKQIPFFGDGDTGYGNAVNVKRTVRGYAAAGAAGIMIEDQLAPKRCGHTRDKAVVDRGEALARVRAAVDAANEGGGDILIMARTDARDAWAGRGASAPALPRGRCRPDVPRGAAHARRDGDVLPRGRRPEDGQQPRGRPHAVAPARRAPRDGLLAVGVPLDLLAASIVAQRAALEGLREGAERRDDALPLTRCRRRRIWEYYREEAL